MDGNLYAVDDCCNSDDFVGFGNGFLVFGGRLDTHLARLRSYRGDLSGYSRAQSRLAFD